MVLIRKQAKCVSELKKQTENHPQFANFDDPGINEGTSDLPDGPFAAAPSGQPKLKLTFNNIGANGAAEFGEE